MVPGSNPGAGAKLDFSKYFERGILFIMNKTRFAFSLFLLVFGIFMFVYGGYDDSPGGQLLGVLAAAFGVYGIIKSRKKN